MLGNFPGGAGDPAPDQQHPPGGRTLGQGIMHRFLDALDLLRREERLAVLVKVDLPIALGDHEPAIGRVNPREDDLAGILERGGQAVQTRHGQEA